MALSVPEKISIIEDKLKFFTQRENKGTFIRHLNNGEGPFQVVDTYYYGSDDKHPGWPADGYFKIIVGGVVGWVTGIDSGHWKIKFGDPIPVNPPPVPVKTIVRQYCLTEYSDGTWHFDEIQL